MSILIQPIRIIYLCHRGQLKTSNMNADINTLLIVHDKAMSSQFLIIANYSQHKGLRGSYDNNSIDISYLLALLIPSNNYLKCIIIIRESIFSYYV